MSTESLTFSSPLGDEMTLNERIEKQVKDFRWQHPPLPLSGAKARRWWREIYAISEILPSSWNILDAFGGTLCVTWLMKHHRNDLRIVTNDMKNVYAKRISAIDQTIEIWNTLHEKFEYDSRAETNYVKFTDEQWTLFNEQLARAEDKITVMSWANGGGSPRNKLPNHPPNKALTKEWMNGMEMMDIELDDKDDESLSLIERFDFFILDPPYMYSNSRNHYACEDYKKARRWTSCVINSGKPFMLWDKAGSSLCSEAENAGGKHIKETAMGYTGEDSKGKETLILKLPN